MRILQLDNPSLSELQHGAEAAEPVSDRAGFSQPRPETGEDSAIGIATSGTWIVQLHILLFVVISKRRLP